MQSEVISDILAVEDRAEQIIANANKVARDTLSAADAQASEIVRKAVDEEREQGRKAIAEAEEQVAEALQSYEEQLKDDDSIDTSLSQTDIDAIANKIVARVCSTIFQGLQEGTRK